MYKFFAVLYRNLFVRIIVILLIVMIPATVSTAWLAATFQTLFGGDTFGMFTEMLQLSFPPALVTGALLVYLVEFTMIKGRAVKSGGWVAFRFAAYLVIGYLAGVVVRWYVQFGGIVNPPQTESVFFVTTIANSFILAIIFTISETALQVVADREAELNQHIEALHIDIDRLKEQEEISAIVDSEYFQRLQKTVLEHKAKKNA